MTDTYKGRMSPEEQEATFGNPKDAETALAETYVERMIKGKPLYREVQIPIPGWEPFRMRPLAWDVEARCQAEARQFVEKELGLDSTRHTDLVGNEATLRIAYLASFTAESDPEMPVHLARTLEEWRAFPALTSSLLALLWVEYEETKLQLAPDFEALPMNVAEEMVQAIKKNRDRSYLRRWPRQWLLALIDFMADRDKTSTGSSPDTSGSSESSEPSSI